MSVYNIYRVILSLTQIVSYMVCMSENLNAALQNNTVIPAHHDKWEAVNITYTKNFPYDWSSRTNTQGCMKVSVLSGNKKKIAQLRCDESIILLRPDNIVDQWDHFQKKNGYLLFTMKEFGLVNIHAQMTKIILPHSVQFRTKSSDMPAGTVTGIFFQHGLTREYRLENIKSHIVSTLTATPDHPVYVKNKKAFLPIDTITPDDQLSNRYVHFLHGRSGYGGINHRSHQLTAVYNIEVYKNHTYFVGNDRILVHNICKFTLQEIYYYFKERGCLSNRIVKRTVKYVDDRAERTKSYQFDNLYIQFPESEISQLFIEHAAKLKDGEENFFSYKRMFRKMGFREERGPFPACTPKKRWHLKYPIAMDMYENDLLPQLKIEYTFDLLVRRITGKEGLCYADLYRFVELVSPSSLIKYTKLTADDHFAAVPMLMVETQTFRLSE